MLCTHYLLVRKGLYFFRNAILQVTILTMLILHEIENYESLKKIKKMLSNLTLEGLKFWISSKHCMRQFICFHIQF